MHDKSYAKLLPFTIESVKSHPAWDITYYGEYAFIGTGSNGEILRSSNKYHWGVYYKTNDIHVYSVYIDGSYLYAGTSPSGKIYRFNLENDNVTLYGEFGSSIVGFVTYNSEVYVATEFGEIYKYDSIYDQWSSEYRAYGEITEVDVINGKIYLSIKGGNIITYNGSNWELLDLGVTNIESLRKVSGEFSFVDFLPLNRSSIIKSEGDAQIFEVYPQNRSVGLSCIAQDGSSIIMGSYNKARIYSLLDGDLKLLFDTNSNNVHDLLNLDIGVNLAAIDNKLYLIHCGALTETPDDPDDPDDQNEGKVVVVTFPNGGEQFELGSDITIQWSSIHNQNDVVKLSLYKGNAELEVIASQTTNNGRFEWTIPLSLDTGDDYKVYVEWLSAGSAAENEKDLSDNPFSISITTTTTTTTTTGAPNPEAPDISACRGIPILELPGDEYITNMSKDSSLNAVVLLTSTGRVLECNEAVINGYLTGNRTIWANVRDGHGITNIASTQFMYALYNRIVEVNKEKEIVKWKYVEKPSAIPVEKASGIFTSPALYVQEDIGSWRTLLWTETKPSNTEIIVSIKAASTLEELESKNWEYSYKSQTSEGASITRDLSNVDLNGQYAQIKVNMESQEDIGPSMADISLVYSTKQASYFFTTRFSLKSGADVSKGLIIAEITAPVNTEVQVGICNTESSNWNDYKIVSLERFFDIGDYENLKIGLKFTSYDDINVPVAGNFAMMFSGKEIQKINQ